MIKLEAKMESLGEFMEAARESAKKSGFDDATVMQIELAVEEAAVNIMKYAYPEGGGEIGMSFSSDGGGLEIVITDSGVPFDVTAKEDPDVDAPLEERGIGGLGIFFVRRFMDDVLYERRGGTNVLTLRKKTAAGKPTA
ncbi:MAG: ATP-binding protein [Victivallales bacterium]|nr:ATP-binding protein [Victivallales bacterium]